MEVRTTLDSGLSPHTTAVAIGCFDGVHLAHRRILENVIEQKKNGLRPAVFTFADSTNKGVPQLMTTEEKLTVFRELGIQVVFLLSFDQVKNCTPEEFVRKILADKCGAKQVCCGYNFRFGKGGKGDAALLRSLCTPLGLEVTVVPQLNLELTPVSSTRIRTLLEEGRVEMANALLGREFSFRFPVVHGRKLGRQIGVPTMNQLLPETFLCPKKGVYVSTTEVAGKEYHSVTNIGLKPTVGGEAAPSAETWLSDFSGDLYGKEIRVTLHHFLRPERKFPNLEELRSQIEADIIAAKHWSEHL